MQVIFKLTSTDIAIFYFIFIQYKSFNIIPNLALPPLYLQFITTKYTNFQ